MSQNSLVLPTTGTVSGLQMTQDVNYALDTLNTLNCGPSAPSTVEAGMLWHDTTNNVLKIRNLANSAWIVIGAIDETNNIWTPPIGGSASTSIASATTCDLWSVPQSYVTITGTTTITALCGASDSVVGTIKKVIFSGVLTLTYNATSLILPGAANITTAAGDTMEVISLGSGNVRVLFYSPATGKALVASSSSALAYNAIAGLLPSSQSFSSSTSASMTITAGQAADSTNATMLSGGSFSWNITNGNAINGYQGGTTLPNSSTVHFFICQGGSGTGSFASTSLTPTLPSGYNTYYRRIFSLNTNSSGVLYAGAPTEISGGAMTYYYGTQILDVNGAAPGTSSRTLYTLTVPQGISVEVLYRATKTADSKAHLLTSAAETDVAPTGTNSLAWTTAPGSEAGDGSGLIVTMPRDGSLITNTSAQIGWRSSGASTVYFVTRGFVDFRRS